MKTSDAYAELLRIGRPIVQIDEASARLDLSMKRTTLHLRSLERAGLVRRIKPGLWALRPGIESFAIPPYLTSPFPAYVSVWSALRHHGMIEQIPRSVFVVSTDRTNRVTTSFGVFAIHHIAPDLFDGFEGTEENGYVATPEKALFDTVYLRAPSGGRTYLPETELPSSFDDEKFEAWLGRITTPRLRTIVERGLQQALAKAALVA